MESQGAELRHVKSGGFMREAQQTAGHGCFKSAIFSVF
jgi:hypothetical protein